MTATAQLTGDRTTDNDSDDVAPSATVVQISQAIAASPRLSARRLEMLPLRGPGAAATAVQGRNFGPATSPEGLSDLISSIAHVGVLQPIAVEEYEQDGRTRRMLVVGERRYRAARWGALHLPENPNFAEIPAIVCPGPLQEAERRTLQLIENLAREDLQPGELAVALLMERCALLAINLVRAGRTIPAEINTMSDPVARWKALEKLRGTATEAAAPWPMVLRRLGLQMTPRKARMVASAFTHLPRDISEEMDEAKVALATRLLVVKLARSQAGAATELWEAVRQLGRTDLLAAAAEARISDSALDPVEAVEAADLMHRRANAARSNALVGRDVERDDEYAGPASGTAVDELVDRPTAAAESETGRPHLAVVADLVSAATVEAALGGMRGLRDALADGAAVDRYTAGSIRLLCRAVLDHLDGTAATAATATTREPSIA